MKMFRKQKHDQTRCGFAVSTFCRTWFRLSRGWRSGWEGLQSFAGISIITRNSYSVHRNPFCPLLLPFLPSVAPSRPFLILCKLYYFHCLFTSLPILYPSAQDLRRLSGFCRVSPFLSQRIKIISRNAISSENFAFRLTSTIQTYFAPQQKFNGIYCSISYLLRYMLQKQVTNFG